MKTFSDDTLWLGCTTKISTTLCCDLAITSAQAQRWYNLPPITPAAILAGTAGVDDSSHYHAVTHQIRTSQTTNALVSIQFLTVDRATVALPAWQLRQLAAIAEGRHMLGVPADLWKVNALKRSSPKGGVIADALYKSSYGLVSVEHDSGEYEQARIDKHILAYAQLGPQLWIVHTAARKRTVLERLRALCPERCDHRVLVARWW